MSDPTAQEPTMEEILASIRRIISEDDHPAAEAAPAHEEVPAPPPAPEPEEEEDDEEALELNEPAPPEPVAHDPIAHEPIAPRPPVEAPFTLSDSHGDLDILPPPPVVETPKPSPPPLASTLSEEDDTLISSQAASAAASHFGTLAQNISMPPPYRSLEDVVRELLRPMLKEWLDQNLTAIVEQTVAAEVERISRRRVY